MTHWAVLCLLKERSIAQERGILLHSIASEKKTQQV